MPDYDSEGQYLKFLICILPRQRCLKIFESLSSKLLLKQPKIILAPFFYKPLDHSL